jgi:hypothetical protein
MNRFSLAVRGSMVVGFVPRMNRCGTPGRQQRVFLRHRPRSEMATRAAPAMFSFTTSCTPKAPRISSSPSSSATRPKAVVAAFASMHIRPEEELGIQIAQCEVGVGHCWLCAAAAIACRTRLRACGSGLRAICEWRSGQIPNTATGVGLGEDWRSLWASFR